MGQERNEISRVLLVALALLTATGALAQGQAPAAGQKPAAPQPAPLTLDSAAPPVSAEEDAAMKAFRDVPVSEVEKKEQAGEDFVKKYPQSRYAAEVYGWLVKGYLN